MTLSSTQTYIYKLTEALRDDLSKNLYGQEVLSISEAYTSGTDSSEALDNLCYGLNMILSVFSTDISEKISTNKAISDLMVPCQMLKVGATTFYHDDHSHSFYKCQEGTPTLLYTVGATLASFQAAENACRAWVNDASMDYYGSYTNDCTNAVILENPVDYCLAGRDLSVV